MLAHEEGHIYNKHFEQPVIAGKNIKDEYEANEFAHGILNQSLNHKIINGIITHKVMSIVVASIVVLIAVGSYTLPIVLDWSDYYVTPTSDRYHTRDCKYVKDKKTRHRLTNAELKDSDYEPCQICLPD